MTAFLARLAMDPFALGAVFCDAQVATQWNPTQAGKADSVCYSFNVKKTKQAALAIGSGWGLALAVKNVFVRSVDVWKTSTGVGLLDFIPAIVEKPPSPTNRATLARLAKHYDTLPSTKPRVAGTLEITSGMLAVFEPEKRFRLTRRKLAAGKPVEVKGGVAVPLENGTYRVLVEVLGPRGRWHTDALGVCRARIRIERLAREDEKPPAKRSR
jgi:hypothetical protein